MTNTDDTNFFDATERHLQTIAPAHRAAFRGPIVHDYQPGAIVWLLDHYNTGIVEGPGTVTDTWAITTSHCDGTVSKHEYKSAHLRPAAMSVEFRWSEGQ